MNEYMDNLIPASKIANLKAGEVVARIGREADNSQKTYLSTYYCKIAIHPGQTNKEEQAYAALPKYYAFGTDEEKEVTLRNNLFKINGEVAEIINTFP